MAEITPAPKALHKLCTTGESVLELTSYQTTQEAPEGVKETTMDQDLIIAVLAALLAISEALALIPKVQANSIFQLVVGLLKKAKDLFAKK